MEPGAFISRRTVQWATSLILVLFIIHFFHDNPQSLAALGNLDTKALFSVCLLQVVSIGLHAARTLLVMNQMSDTRLKYREWLDIFVTGRIINIFVPQGGNLYKAHAVKKNFDFTYTDYISSSGLFFWLDMCGNLVLAAIIFLVTPASSEVPISVGHVFVALIVLLAAAPLFTIVFRHVLKWVTVPVKVRKSINAFFLRFWSTANNTAVVVKVLALGPISFASLYIMHYILFSNLGGDVIPSALALILIVYKLSLIVTLTPGNVGVREWAVGGSCVLFGIDPGIGLIVALLMRASHYISLGGLAIALYAHRAVTAKHD